MRRLWQVLLLFALALPWLAWAAAAGQWDDFRALRGHTVLAGNDGPALRFPTTLAVDRRGRVWIGENTGLSRLDGDLVRRYAAADVAAMAAGFIRVFHPLDNGDVLIGGDREGLLHWRLQHDDFVPVQVMGGGDLSRVNAVEPAAGGGAWVAAEQGLFHWDAQRGSLSRVELGIGQQRHSPRIFDVQQMDDGTLWIAAAPGLYRRGPGAVAFEAVSVDDPHLQQRLRQQLSWELGSDDQGRLWVGMMQHGVVVLERDGRAWAPAGLDGLGGLHAGTTIRSLLQVGGQMWLGSDGQGLLVVENGRARALPVNLDQFLGGRNLHVLELARAADGRVWVASSRGVFHLDPAPAGIVELDLKPAGSQAYEQPAMARALHMDRRGRLWVGMFGGLIQVLDPVHGSRRQIQLPAPLDASDVVALAEDGRGRIWALGNGVAVIDADTLAVQGGGPLPQVPVQRYLAMASDGGQRVWLGGREGILELDLQGRIVRRMDDGSAGLRSNRVLQLAWQPGQLWVGTAEGLHRLDLQHWRAQPVATGSAQQGGLPGNRFISSLASAGGEVLAGTLEGLSAGDGSGGALPLRLPTDGQGVVGVAADAQGGVWMALADAGLLHRDAAGQVRRFGAHDGLHPDTRMHGRGMLATADGHVFMAVGSGVLMLEPGLLQRPPLALPALQPQVVSLLLDGQAMATGQLPGDGGRVQLARTVERLALRFSAMDPVAPQRRHYSYRLEGLDSRWIATGEGGQVPEVLYSRLPVGQYTLLLRTTSDDYPGQAWVTRIGLEVPAAWYQQWWVQLLALLLFLLAVAGAVRWRLHAARKRQRRLQQRVLDSTAELRQANARLAQLVGEDALTGLDNRRRGFERLAELHTWRQRMRGSDCVVLMDLDHFKKINDRHGHLGGDAVLRAVGQLLRSQLRAIDIAARYGGEELLLVLVDADLAQGQATVERIRAALQDMVVDHDGQQIAVSASFGMALSDPTQPVERWIERADAALYRAKHAGRGRLCVDATEPPTQVV